MSDTKPTDNKSEDYKRGFADGYATAQTEVKAGIPILRPKPPKDRELYT